MCEIEAIDLSDLLRQLRLLLVMCQMMMTFPNSDLRKGAVAAIIGQQQCGNAGTVCLKGHDQHVVHQIDVIAEVRRYSRGSRLIDIGQLIVRLGRFQA